MSQPIDHAEDRPFQVKIASTGEVFTIQAGESVTDILADHGIDIPVSCGHGLCGTCLTGVLEGIPEHRDFHLTREEREANRQFLPCCSRARTPLLVLDL